MNSCTDTLSGILYCDNLKGTNDRVIKRVVITHCACRKKNNFTYDLHAIVCGKKDAQRSLCDMNIDILRICNVIFCNMYSVKC